MMRWLMRLLPSFCDRSISELRAILSKHKVSSKVCFHPSSCCYPRTHDHGGALTRSSECATRTVSRSRILWARCCAWLFRRPSTCCWFCGSSSFSKCYALQQVLRNAFTPLNCVRYNLVANIVHDSPVTTGKETVLKSNPLTEGSYRVHVQNRVSGADATCARLLLS